jgi:hypothetical protein
MNLAASTVMMAGLLATAGVLYYGPAGDRQAQAAPAVVQTEADSAFRLRASSGASCAVMRGDAVSQGRAMLRIEPACATLLPGMADAKFWRENADGSITFTEESGDPIVSFSVADGAAYESFEPATPLLSLDAAE